MPLEVFVLIRLFEDHPVYQETVEFVTTKDFMTARKYADKNFGPCTAYRIDHHHYFDGELQRVHTMLQYNGMV